MYRILFYNMQILLYILSYEPLFICYYNISGPIVNEIFYQSHSVVVATGVRKYWLVNPDKLKVIVYDFTKEDYTIYRFDSVIPVTIWDGRCQIDFSKLYDQIRFIYERKE